MLNKPDVFMADPPANFDGIFMWDYLNEALQRGSGVKKAQLTDIDAHMELGGHHLIFETKREGVPLPRGQERALEALWAKGYFMVIILWGKDEPIEAQIYYPNGLRKKVWKGDLTRERLCEICENWARWAKGNPSPFQYIDMDHA